jgi:hypothetical protein
MHTIIEIRPHGLLWKVFEAPGVEPIFPHREDAILYATSRSRSHSGEIRILDANGAVEKVIPFSKT